MSFSNVSDPGAGISSTSPNTSSNDPEPNQSKESLPRSVKYIKISNSNAQLKQMDVYTKLMVYTYTKINIDVPCSE